MLDLVYDREHSVPCFIFILQLSVVQFSYFFTDESNWSL